MLRKIFSLFTFLIVFCGSNATAGPILSVTAKGTYHGGLEAPGAYPGGYTGQPHIFQHTVLVDLNTCKNSSNPRSTSCLMKGIFSTVNSKFETMWTLGSVWMADQEFSVRYGDYLIGETAPAGYDPEDERNWRSWGGGTVMVRWDRPNNDLTDVSRRAIHYVNNSGSAFNASFDLREPLTIDRYRVAETGFETLDIVVIPEPATIPLLMLGLLGLFASRRKKT